MVPIDLQSLGMENAVGFSLNFGPTQLAFSSVSLGTDSTDCRLIPNTANARSGQIGVILSKPFDKSYTAGTRHLVVLTFTVSAGATGSSSITFGDTPVTRQISDPNANELPGSYANGSVTISGNGGPVSFSITTSSSPANGGTTSGDGAYVSGTTAVVTASASSNYNFVNWTANGDVVSTGTNYPFAVTKDRKLVANFTAVTGTTFTINVSASPANGGAVSGGGSYASGATATLTATSNNGFQFVNWTEGNTAVSTSSNYPFTVSKDRALVANFTQVSGSAAVVITSPATSATYSTSNGTLALSGSASDPRGISVIGWDNDRNGSGVATGRTSWSVPGIRLYPGVNTIHVSEYGTDSKVNSRATLEVTYTNPAGQYYGLIQESGSNGVFNGYIQITVTLKGRFSGALWYGGVKSPLGGAFDSKGESHLTVNRGRGLPALTVIVNLSNDDSTILTGVLAAARLTVCSLRIAQCITREPAHALMQGNIQLYSSRTQMCPDLRRHQA
jgi:hypothetical protein